jgi:uncharacterized protein (DUF736 family)
MSTKPNARNVWSSTTRAFGVLALLIVLLALAVGVSMAAPEAPAGKSSIGDCVWNDTDVDGFQSLGEVGINGVVVWLYKDGANGNPKDGVLQAGEKISDTVTVAGGANATGTACATAGYYDFPVDGDETYWTEVIASNFNVGGPLDDYVFTSENTVGDNPHKKIMPLNQLDYNEADFGYVKVDLKISITPNTDTNAVNDPHTFTVKVEKKIGSGAWTPVAGVSPAVTVSPAPSSITNNCAVANATNANGECTVVINSTSATVYTASASVTASINVDIPDGIGGTISTPVSRTRATGDAKNTAAGGSGNATKTYVDLRISVTPNTDTNAVNDPHTFTVKVEQKIGNGAWTPVAGVSPAVTVSPTPSSITNNCATPGVTNANGECTVVINSTSATVYTASASVTVSVSSQSITRTTGTAANTAAGGSGNATKTYVDLRISVTPNTDTNAVNDPHTFTVKVEQKIGNGAWTPVAGVSPAVTVSPTPSSITNNCDGTPVGDVTNANGECTVVINSTSATVYTASASVTVSVSSQSITRTTGTAANTAAGGSGNATKTYVDLRISITPNTDTNAVNDPHTFTVKVEQKIGNGAWTPVAGVSPAVTVSPTPSSTTNNCATPGVTNANGECTVVINSTSATVYTASASVTVSVSSQSITRTTGDGCQYGRGWKRQRHQDLCGLAHQHHAQHRHECGERPPHLHGEGGAEDWQRCVDASGGCQPCGDSQPDAQQHHQQLCHTGRHQCQR